jgi:AcrR family transcriptional regulator
MPLLAPVTTNVRPVCGGRSAAVHFFLLMGSKVDDDNNDVNDNIVSSRPYHHGNLRAELLAGAERALAEGGDLSLRELARRVGVSHAAPRRHFADKQALLDALAQDGFERLGCELNAALERAGPSFDERLLALARTYVRFAARHAALLELMFAGKHREGVPAGVGEAAARAMTAPLAVIVDGQSAGEVVGGAPERVGAVVFALLQGLAALFTGGMVDEAELDATVAEAVEGLVLGLRPRPS